MGISYYSCEKCEESLSEYDGHGITNCKNNCDSWICYYCVNENSCFRDDYDEDNENMCVVCECEESDKNIYKQKLNNIINKLKILKISKKNIDILKNDIKNL